MGRRIIPTNYPARPHLIEFFNPHTGKVFATVKLPAPKEPNRKSQREQEPEGLKMFAGDVCARFN